MRYSLTYNQDPEDQEWFIHERVACDPFCSLVATVFDLDLANLIANGLNAPVMKVTPEIIGLLERLLETPEELLNDPQLRDDQCTSLDWGQESLATKGEQKRILEIISQYKAGCQND